MPETINRARLWIARRGLDKWNVRNVKRNSRFAERGHPISTARDLRATNLVVDIAELRLPVSLIHTMGHCSFQ